MSERMEWIACLFLAVIAGCRSYEPAAIDWVRENSAWMERGELMFSSLDDVESMALIGNLDLNQMRLKRASSQKVAEATGRWDDPEVDADLLRIVNPAEHPFLGGISMAFTLPLSGVKGLERKAAMAYSRADAAEIVVAERETAVSARCAAVRLLAADGTVRALKDFAADARVSGAFAAAERLSEAGELSKTETASARLRRHQRLHRLREAEAEYAESEQTLRSLLGVAPSVKLTFVEGCESSADSVERGGNACSDRRRPVDYVAHPMVRAAVCRLEGGEAALEAEIRRQYPDLKFGPAYSREEGMDRLGIVAGATLPLWNRNRRGIAEAEGTRDELRENAVKTWREVVLQADAARRTLARLLDHTAESPPERGAADALADAGEINALEYLAVREEELDGELVERAWRRDVRLARENLKKFELEVE